MTNKKDFKRQVGSKALINTNVSAFKQYKQIQAKERKLQKLEEEVQQLKVMVTKLLDRE